VGGPVSSALCRLPGGESAKSVLFQGAALPTTIADGVSESSTATFDGTEKLSTAKFAKNCRKGREDNLAERESVLRISSMYDKREVAHFSMSGFRIMTRYP
jgi:hypothetical protein